MRTIRGKMLVNFGGVLSVLLIVFGVVMYLQSRNAVVPLTKRLSKEVLTARADEMSRLIEGYLRDVSTVVRRQPLQGGDPASINAELAMVTGSDYEMLFYADASGHFRTTEGQEGNVADRVYFKAVIEEGVSYYISEPIVSRASGEPVFVVAYPVLDEQGNRIGMVGATVLLETLTGIASNINISHQGFGYVVGGDGMLIAHPSEDWRLKLNLLDSEAFGFRQLDEVGRRMVAGQSGFASYSRPDGSAMIAIFHPVRHSPGWSLGIAISEDELMGPARHLMHAVILLMVLMVAAVLLVVWIVSNGIAAPVRMLSQGVKTVGEGRLDQTLDIRTGDEIEQLASAFNTMQDDLKAHIETLRRTTAEKERIERDLHVANKIQTSMLPRTFPPFPDIDNLDLFATMEPAREVGGDFYDFFLVDDHRLCFCIGDVSGKGVGAALFMVITRTILKNQALQGHALAEIMRGTNEMLCAGNEESMFVTIFMGILDVSTGELEYVCAGHNPPLLARRDAPFAFLEVVPGIVAGAMEGVAFRTMKTTLAPGDLLYLYTDGVTEGMNAREALFGEERMLQAANACSARRARTVIAAVRAALDGYVQGTPASDDVTMLALGIAAGPSGTYPPERSVS